ncbi:hypothetical protein [Kitasatospora purpeofusca]|uniref:hypothetical protein n=1 Tax=Kitasatospora purpeofusca TaxID=67352 RepID=UPI003F4AD8A0
MLLFGLLLVAVVGAFTGLLIAGNLSGGPEYQAAVLGHDLVMLNSLGIFLAGLALALLFCFGLVLVGAGRSHRRARAVRHGRHAAPVAARPDGRSEDRAVERRISDEPAVREPVAEPDPKRAEGEAGAPGESPRRDRRLHHL